MRYFKPDLRLSTELPPQTEVEDKLGGLPWGLSPGMWPKCRFCGRSLSLLAQFMHHHVRLDLGREGRVLNVFYCNNPEQACGSYEGGGGANACFVAEPEDLVPRLAALPSDLPGLEREARVVGWLERDDGILEEDVPSFFYWDDYEDLPDSVKYAPNSDTKLGSVPNWAQGPDAPGDDWRFAGQLTDYYLFLTRPALDAKGIWEHTDEDGAYYLCSGPIFGDGGTAYFFLRDTAGTPEGWFMWQNL